jgi:hypothetical protein
MGTHVFSVFCLFSEQDLFKIIIWDEIPSRSCHFDDRGEKGFSPMGASLDFLRLRSGHAPIILLLRNEVII